MQLDKYNVSSIILQDFENRKEKEKEYLGWLEIENPSTMEILALI